MPKNIEKLAIANRGEVAVRIIRACQDLGLDTVLLHSEADIDSIAYRLADECVLIGGSPVGESYLNIQANIDGALSVDADAIHPGFGFLSENADFARACEKAKIIFVGPSPECIDLFGDKISAKNHVQKVGAPFLPGYQGEDQSEEKLLSEIDQLGLPVMVKAAAGGGGRGLRVVHDHKNAVDAIRAAQREGESAFGSSQVFLEKYLDRAKHIEVQIFGDASGKAIHLGERECSVQRRHQKVIEEAPSPAVDDVLRKKMTAAALEIVESAQYKGAGTVEFLMQDGEFYFLEVNTRLQVEHPVSEMVYAMDLVKAQILCAQGKSIIPSQEDLVSRGHAIECRIYAEDAYENGLPSTGVLGSCKWPQGPGRRFEVGFEKGDEVTSFYDSMIAKVIVWDETRYRAIQKMRQTLKETVIFGLKTNIPHLMSILNHEEFVEGKMTTQFLNTYFPEGLKSDESNEIDGELLEKISSQLGGEVGEVSSSGGGPNPWMNPWGGQ